MRCWNYEKLKNVNKERSYVQAVYCDEKYWGHLQKVWIDKSVTWKLASKFVANEPVHEKFVDTFAEKTSKKCWKLLLSRQTNKYVDKTNLWKVLDIRTVFKKLKCNFGAHPLQKYFRFFEMWFVAKSNLFWKIVLIELKCYAFTFA